MLDMIVNPMPGQTFSGRGSFWYQAVNSFEYDGRSLNNCSVRQYNSLKVMGPPMSQPAFFWDDMSASLLLMSEMFAKELKIK